jgi:putative DNA primase/helicase
MTSQEQKALVPKNDGHNISISKINSHDVVGNLSNDRRLIYCAGTFYEYSDGYYRERDDQIVKQWVADLVGKDLTKQKAEEIIYFLQARVFIEPKDLNNTNLLNLKNGFFDLDTWTSIPHSPIIFSTIQLDVTFDPEAKCDLWLKTLHEIFPDEVGDQKISVLQEFFGLCLTKETKYEKALLCIGEGSNGKSVVLWILQHLLKKENVSAIPLEKFDNSHYLVNLFGKLANISIETNAKSEVYDSTFKAVVTGDLIQADQKFKPAIHFNPFCKLVFATNNLPRVDDKSDAFFRRLLIIRFNRQFTETEQNKDLKYQLLSELDGILIWSLEGLKRLRDRGYFQNPDDMKKEIEDYRRENNSVLVFVEEVCELDPNKEISKSKLYSIFQEWSKLNGFHPMGKLKFGKELRRQLDNKVSDSRVTNGDRIWIGIHLNENWSCEIVELIPLETGINIKDL